MTAYLEILVIIRLLGQRDLSNKLSAGDRNSDDPSTMRSPGDRILLGRRRRHRRLINSGAVRRRGRLLIARRG